MLTGLDGCAVLSSVPVSPRPWGGCCHVHALEASLPTVLRPGSWAHRWGPGPPLPPPSPPGPPRLPSAPKTACSERALSVFLLGPVPASPPAQRIRVLPGGSVAPWLDLQTDCQGPSCQPPDSWAIVPSMAMIQDLAFLILQPDPGSSFRILSSLQKPTATAGVLGESMGPQPLKALTREKSVC